MRCRSRVNGGLDVLAVVVVGVVPCLLNVMGGRIGKMLNLMRHAVLY